MHQLRDNRILKILIFNFIIRGFMKNVQKNTVYECVDFIHGVANKSYIISVGFWRVV